MLAQLLEEGPVLITAILGSFTVFVSLMWLARSQVRIFGWLALVGALWFTHSALGLVDGTPGLEVMRWMPIYFLPAAVAGFVLCYLQTPLLKQLPAALAGAGFLAGLLAFAGGLGGWLGHATFVLSAVTGAVLVAQVSQDAPRLQNGAFLSAGAVGLASALHDAGLRNGNWTGAGFDLLPYAGLLIFSISLFLLVQRLLHALSVEQDFNVILESRTRAANASLAASEAARRALETSSAIHKERDRLMREIHDGIGSSLVTAIAASEQRGQTVDGASILRRALTDLRVAVDSLEPVQGDIATLMASLRYRVEPDLKKAGIGFDWQVERVPEISWLDAVNALHVLRIFQEAFSNIVGHAEATKITVRCQALDHQGRAGVLIEVADNGKGFADAGGPKGHGLKNMASRTESLDAILNHTSVLGKGTNVSLWLPVNRHDEDK